MKKKSRAHVLSPKARSLTSRRLMDFLPNMVTVMALCAGLTAVRFAWTGIWEMALMAVLLAGLLDGMDGRLARFLGSTSDFGAELDSLSDFLCFGVAPALLVYAFSFSSWSRMGWAFCLFFTTCTALRLARFNVYRIAATKIAWGAHFSIGVPAPAGAFIALLPLMAHLAFDCVLSPLCFCISLGVSALLMISRFPTFVFKNIQLSPRRMAFSLLAVTFVSASLLSAPWGTLFLLGICYLGSIPWTLMAVRRLKQGMVKDISAPS